jgi:nitrogenase molybdenum-iron protein alpha/beta subunit
MQGILDAALAIGTHLIDRSVQPEPGLVNIVGEKNLATNAESNFLAIRSLLEALDLRVNCRFIRATGVEAIRGFMKAPINLLAHEDAMGRALRAFLEDRFQARFLDHSFPVGFEATARWVRALGAETGREARAEVLVAGELERYETGLEVLRSALAGKRLMIVTPNHQVDWVLELAQDLGMEIVSVGILASAWEDALQSRFADRIPIRLGYRREDRDRDILALQPDLTLTNTVWPSQPSECRVELLPYVPDCGFLSGLEEARRWSRALKLPAKEGWRDDLHA